MTWFKVDDMMPSSPKARSIPRAVRMRALGVWMACGAWSSHHLTDGLVSQDVVEDEGGKLADAQALVTARLWHADGHDCARCPQPGAGSYQFHDWFDYQPTREEVQAKRTAEKERKAEWRARKEAARKAKASGQAPESNPRPGVSPAGVPVGQTPDGQRPSQRPSGGRPALPVPVPVPDPKTLSTSAPTERVADATAPVDRPLHAGDLVAIWVEACEANGVRPSAGQRSQVGKQARELLANNEPDKVVEATRQAGAKGYASIDRELTAMNGRHIPPARSTTDERFAQAQALKHGPPTGPQLALPGGP